MPAPLATGRLFDLSADRGPVFVVLRGDDATALEALTRHLVTTGAVGSPVDAVELLADSRPEPVEVVW